MDEEEVEVWDGVLGGYGHTHCCDPHGPEDASHSHTCFHTHTHLIIPVIIMHISLFLFSYNMIWFWYDGLYDYIHVINRTRKRMIILTAATRNVHVGTERQWEGIGRRRRLELRTLKTRWRDCNLSTIICLESFRAKQLWKPNITDSGVFWLRCRGWLMVNFPVSRIRNNATVLVLCWKKVNVFYYFWFTRWIWLPTIWL